MCASLQGSHTASLCTAAVCVFEWKTLSLGACTLSGRRRDAFFIFAAAVAGMHFLFLHLPYIHRMRDLINYRRCLLIVRAWWSRAGRASSILVACSHTNTHKVHFQKKRLIVLPVGRSLSVFLVAWIYLFTAGALAHDTGNVREFGTRRKQVPHRICSYVLG